MQKSLQLSLKPLKKIFLLASNSLITIFLPILEVQNQSQAPPMNAYEAAVQILEEFPLIDG